MLRFSIYRVDITNEARKKLKKNSIKNQLQISTLQKHFQRKMTDSKDSMQNLNNDNSATMKPNGQLTFDLAESHFVEWAKKHSKKIESFIPTDDNSDLEVIAESIGNASFVALSEGYHNCNEMMSLHYRIIRYLIENHGFNTVLSESGLPESRIIHDYILGEHKKSEDMWGKGLNKMYGAWKEGRQLIEFMHQYNLKHDNILQYYGTDIGGFYKNWKTPLESILQYLKKVDEEYHEYLFQNLRHFMNLLATDARLKYSEQLSPSKKDDLARILDEAVENFNRKEEEYLSNGSYKDFQWARQGMISMQLAENYYRNFDNRKSPESSKYVGLNGREIAMARNSLWALKQRDDARIIWIDHVIHTKTKSQYQDETWGFFTPAGQLISHVLGKDFFSIGMVYGKGKFWNQWQRPTDRFVDVVPCWHRERRSLEKSLSKCGNFNFFLNWGKAIRSSFECQYWMSSTFSMRENDYFIQLEPREWNACIYLDETNPATEATRENTLEDS